MTTKICNYCERDLPLEFFGSRKESPDGKAYQCKDCRRERTRLNKLGITFQTVKQKKWDADIVRGFRVCEKCSVEKSIDEYIITSRGKATTRGTCKSCHAEEQRDNRLKNKVEDHEYHAIRESLNGARKRAKNGGYDFDITIEDLMPFPTHCEISGVQLTYGQGDKKNGASLDKIIPSKGYTKGNVRIISSKVNMAKSDLTLAQLKKLITYIEKYSKG